MFIQVALDSHLNVGEGGGGMVAAPFIPQIEKEEVDFVVSDILEGGVDGRKLKGATVL